MTDVQTASAAYPAPGVLSRIFRTEQDGAAPGDGHEQVVLCHDRSSGLKAIIAIHSTALGPALGGTRFFPYASEEAALEDALNLSRGMSYKNALAGLDLGGGKAVIIGDPNKDKNEAMLRAYGRFVESLRGRYITACDVGTYVQDMDVIARETEFVTGRSPENGGAGDSSILTAFGVFQGMRASAQARWGQPTLRGKRVGVAGVGKVGHYLVGHLVADGATVVITDVSEAAVNRVRAAHPEVEVVADSAALLQSKLDVYAPCALGGALTDATVGTLGEFGTSVVCGAANNQLAHPGVEKDLADRGILYAPDYLVNSGGVIQVADEIEGFNFERAKNKATRIFDTTLEIFTRAAADGVPPAVAADRLAEKRMREISALRSVLLPGARRG
ncbi:Glu/Leu/Phe/Val dehydrogenase dimerization domain-containing protein [Kitasatospora sp. NPDC058218]|uniref:Glu/Leu/Phe/Val dehydrogenase dimerization domain-containing protein n=1 Tax=Kitasatospora sp. NPDC058218 TaxID=3346385 RepID=UPI0036DF74CD